MTSQPPTIPLVPPESWLRTHGQYVTERLRELGHDEHSAINTLLVALFEEAGLAWEHYVRWVSDPQHITAEADLHLALAGVTLTAYALAHQMGERLDDWCAVKLRHLDADRHDQARQP